LIGQYAKHGSPARAVKMEVGESCRGVGEQLISGTKHECT